MAKKIVLNPEVYRAAAKLLHRRRKWYSCHAIEKAVATVGRNLPTYDERLDMSADHKNAYSAMFADACTAAFYMDRMGAKKRQVKAVDKEWDNSDGNHPYWNVVKREDTRHTARQNRIMALLMMADLVEAGATF